MQDKPKKSREELKKGCITGSLEIAVQILVGYASFELLSPQGVWSWLQWLLVWTAAGVVASLILRVLFKMIGLSTPSNQSK